MLTPNFSVWESDPRISQLLNIPRAAIYYYSLVEAGVRVIPDVSFYFYEPDGRLWAEWVNRNRDVQAVSLFCGGKKIHASARALRETLEDITLFHQAARPEVTFVTVESTPRNDWPPIVGRHRTAGLSSAMAWPMALAQRRIVLGQPASPPAALSSHACFLQNCAFNNRAYAHVLNQAESHVA